MSEKCPFCASVEINQEKFLSGTKVGVDEDDGEMVYARGAYCFQNQLAQKERELEQANKRADEAEAKLALVKEARNQLRSDAANGARPVDWKWLSGIRGLFMNRIDAILADTPEVLAVVDMPVCGVCHELNPSATCIDDRWFHRNDIERPCDGECFDAHVIVTRRNGDNGSGE